MMGRSLNPKTIIHTTISDSVIDRHSGYWIPSLLYRKHWSQIYVEYGYRKKEGEKNCCVNVLCNIKKFRSAASKKMRE